MGGGEFQVGAHSHFSVLPGIRQLQLILLKVALLLGVEVHTGVEFQGLVEPSGESGTSCLLVYFCSRPLTFAG